ncbi:MAG TPA: hypothetical protein VN896_07935 [Methylomirabilota bacterium]|nr:hypothetical protein [Methylomirabilota bacterium]
MMRSSTFPLPLMFPESGGAAHGGPEDASEGLAKMQDRKGTWAFNDVMGEWEFVHTIKSGDTLFYLSGWYYGTPSLDGVRAIYHVPQNRAIQGPSPDRGLIPGDKILIPALPQPATAPQGSDTHPAEPPATPPSGVSPVGAPGNAFPGPTPATVPEGWPEGEPFPPVQVPSGDAIEVPSSPSGAHPVLVSTSTPATTTGSTRKGFWTPGKVALAAGVGLTGTALILYLALRKPKRRRAA